MDTPNLLSIHAAIRCMQVHKLDATELVQACAQQIDKLNPRLNAFITVPQPIVSNISKVVSNVNDPSKSLPGIPIAVKDLIDTAGIRTTAGSMFFKENLPTMDAEVVRRIKHEGAVVIGKTNTHEVALGVTTVNPYFGPCHNPWDETRIPGGSSGGSAVAVAAGMALAALGTDTGGSIRIPASLCGIVGLKPTYGRVSLRGVFPLSWNLDHVGPLTHTVKDAALMLLVIAGFDPDDPYSADTQIDDYSARLDGGIRGWRIGMGIGSYVEASDREVLDAIQQSKQVFERLGAVVRLVDVTFLQEAAAANSLMTQADGAAVHRERLSQHADWFGEDVRIRLEAGRDLPSGDYVLARRTQTETKHRLVQFFQEYDILVLPTTPITAPLIEGGNAVEQARRLTRFTAPFNLAGIPAISIPCGLSPSGLPIGLQLITGAWQESRVLQAAAAYEKETSSDQFRPPIN